MYGPGLTGTGSNGADTLYSGGGPNTLIGLGGNDLYYVNNTGDVVTEATNGGYDTVMGIRQLYPVETPNVEAMYLTGSGLTGTGNSSANTLITIGANTLVGGVGNDTFFEFFAGTTNGATVADFNTQLRVMCLLVFSGFGTEAEGATKLTQIRQHRPVADPFRPRYPQRDDHVLESRRAQCRGFLLRVRRPDSDPGVPKMVPGRIDDAAKIGMETMVPDRQAARYRGLFP